MNGRLCVHYGHFYGDWRTENVRGRVWSVFSMNVALLLQSPMAFEFLPCILDKYIRHHYNLYYFDHKRLTFEIFEQKHAKFILVGTEMLDITGFTIAGYKNNKKGLNCGML